MKTEEKAVELLSCPFCGNPPAVNSRAELVSCQTHYCVAEANWASPEKWNTRAPVSQWISVEERLPEQWEDVLLLTNTGGRFVGIYRPACPDMLWQDQNGDHPIDGVTHWQELPPPTKPPTPHTFQIVMPGSDKPIDAK